MYVKNNKGLIAIIIILAILVIALGVYIFKGESIRQWVSKDVPKTTEENNTKYEEDVNKIITLGTGMKRPSPIYVTIYTLLFKKEVYKWKHEILSRVY